MPLLFALLILIPTLLVLLKSDQFVRHRCRIQLLKAQASAAKSLRTLIDLNSQAQVLRIRRQQAELALSLAIAPPARAAALANLAKVQAQQLAFRGKQLALIMSGRTQPVHISSELLRDLKTANYAVGLEPGSAFDVIAAPKTSLTPDYLPSPRFSSTQNLRLRWSIPLITLLPRDWRALASVQAVTEGLQLRGSCAATIEKKENQWIEILNTAKASSRSSL